MVNRASLPNADEDDEPIKLTDYADILNSLEDMHLKENFARDINAHGLESPSAFILPCDLSKHAKFEPGKTATYCYGILHLLDCDILECQAIVLAPNNRFAKYKEKVMRVLGFLLDIEKLVISRLEDQQQILFDDDDDDEDDDDDDDDDVGGAPPPHVLVGTPGNVCEMLRRKLISPNYIKIIVLDELDETLSRGFKDQIYDIFKFFPSKVQVCVYSTTMSCEVVKITRKFMKKPKLISFKRDEMILEGIEHDFIDIKNEERKLDALYALYEDLPLNKSVIFVNTRCKVDWLSDRMRARGHMVLVPHEGMMDNKKRWDAIVREFLSGSSCILITTSLFACNIDVRMVDAVFNYDLPKKNVLRSSGQIRNTGLAINFVTMDDKRNIYDHRRRYNVVIEDGTKCVANILGSNMIHKCSS